MQKKKMNWIEHYWIELPVHWFLGGGLMPKEGRDYLKDGVPLDDAKRDFTWWASKGEPPAASNEEFPLFEKPPEGERLKRVATRYKAEEEAEHKACEERHMLFPFFFEEWLACRRAYTAGQHGEKGDERKGDR